MGLKPKYFTKENAREMQALGVEKRKENKAQDKIVTEVVLKKLLSPIHEGSKQTKLEWLVDKALDNVKDDVDLKDLKDLKDLVEDKTTNNNVKLTTQPSSEEILKNIFGNE